MCVTFNFWRHVPEKIMEKDNYKIFCLKETSILRKKKKIGVLRVFTWANLRVYKNFILKMKGQNGIKSVQYLLIYIQNNSDALVDTRMK